MTNGLNHPQKVDKISFEIVTKCTPPGDSSILEPFCRGEPSIEVAVIHHHRYAFYYWLQWATKHWRIQLPTGNCSPHLISVDWHDDVGCETDYDPNDLRRLIAELKDSESTGDQDCAEIRQTRESNVAAYCVLGLHPLNDGHIQPAQFLNAIGDAYVLCKQKDDGEDFDITDQFGNPHHVRYFSEPNDLLSAISRDPRPAYFDLDVDYFFEDTSMIHGAEVMVSEDEIRTLLNLEHGFLSQLLQLPLHGMTFALEPTYCGGLIGCFRAMSIIMDTIFSGALLSNHVGWRR